MQRVKWLDSRNFFSNRTRVRCQAQRLVRRVHQTRSGDAPATLAKLSERPLNLGPTRPSGVAFLVVQVSSEGTVSRARRAESDTKPLSRSRGRRPVSRRVTVGL